MSKHGIFTKRARRDCLRCSIDEDDVLELVADPQDVVEEQDPGDPNTVFRYLRRRLSDDTILEVTCELRADGRLLILRVIVFSEDSGA